MPNRHILKHIFLLSSLSLNVDKWMCSRLLDYYSVVVKVLSKIYISKTIFRDPESKMFKVKKLSFLFKILFETHWVQIEWTTSKPDKSVFHIYKAAIKCSLDVAMLGRVKVGIWLTGKVGLAWWATWSVHVWSMGAIFGPAVCALSRCVFRSALGCSSYIDISYHDIINQNPILTPPNITISGLNYTAVTYYM